jgi:PPOX class probable F420-dependent enzyme
MTDCKYVALNTFRKSGQPVRTAMWFARESDGRILMQTNSASGKIKRVRNRADVEVAPSDSKGNPLGPFVSGRALIHGPESPLARRSIELLTQHYGWIYRIFNFGLWLFRRKLVYLEVQLDA